MSHRTITATELAARSGASYRQIDYWTRIGVIDPSNKAQGSGTRRSFSVDLVPAVRCVARVQEAFGAGQIAGRTGLARDVLRRVVVDHAAGETVIGPGVRLVWEADQ